MSLTDPTPVSDTDSRDRAFMWYALELARLGEGRTSPNPAVGAVVVKDGSVVGKGYHHCAGDAHAEEEALVCAGPLAAGAELFVSLEPCCHRGRRKPCTESVISAGISRVVAGIADPNPLVSGRGLQILRDAGIDVRCGVLEEECRAINSPFFKLITTKRPFVTAKYAMTLDGKTATASGDSRWISSRESRHYVHQLRNLTDAILVGKNTLHRDNPRLTVRGIRDSRDPIRVVLDAGGTIESTAAVLAVESEAPTWIVCGKSHCERVSAMLSSRDVCIGVDLGNDGRISIDGLLEELGRREVMSLLVEGGGETLASFISGGNVDRVVAFVAPKLTGGRDAPSPLGGTGVSSVADSSRLKHIRHERIGDDLVIVGDLTEWG